MGFICLFVLYLKWITNQNHYSWFCIVGYAIFLCCKFMRVKSCFVTFFSQEVQFWSFRTFIYIASIHSIMYYKHSISTEVLVPLLNEHEIIKRYAKTQIQKTANKKTMLTRPSPLFLCCNVLFHFFILQTNNLLCKKKRRIVYMFDFGAKNSHVFSYNFLCVQCSMFLFLCYFFLVALVENL